MSPPGLGVTTTPSLGLVAPPGLLDRANPSAPPDMGVNGTGLSVGGSHGHPPGLAPSHVYSNVAHSLFSSTHSDSDLSQSRLGKYSLPSGDVGGAPSPLSSTGLPDDMFVWDAPEPKPERRPDYEDDLFVWDSPTAQSEACSATSPHRAHAPYASSTSANDTSSSSMFSQETFVHGNRSWDDRPHSPHSSLLEDSYDVLSPPSIPSTEGQSLVTIVRSDVKSPKADLPTPATAVPSVQARSPTEPSSLSDLPSLSWSCSVCTFSNAADRIVCEMCAQPREDFQAGAVPPGKNPRRMSRSGPSSGSGAPSKSMSRPADQSVGASSSKTPAADGPSDDGMISVESGRRRPRRSRASQSSLRSTAPAVSLPEGLAGRPLENGRFFVIKSFQNSDVLKSIEFNVWASTARGHTVLQKAYAESHKRGPILLLFSVNGSGKFCGLAEMTSSVNFDETLTVWQQDRWSGSFTVKWHLIKDVPNSKFRHIKLPNNENKPVTNSRDTQEIFLPQAMPTLEIFANYKSNSSLLSGDDDQFSGPAKPSSKNEERKPVAGGKSFKTEERKPVAGGNGWAKPVSGGPAGRGVAAASKGRRGGAARQKSRGGGAAKRSGGRQARPSNNPWGILGEIGS